MPGYRHAALLLLQQQQKTQTPQKSTYPWKTTYLWGNIHMLSKKATAEELDENNHKILHNIVEKYLYYAISINPTMFMVLNSLVSVLIELTIKTAKQITQFLNYSTTHPDAVIEYR